MIIFDNVTKYYTANGSRKYILKNVSLTIPTGRNIAILGPNGAGKSTTLRLIGGAEAPNSGTVSSDQMISWPLGLASGFQGSLTARQNVLFVCEINGFTKEEIKSVMAYVVDFSELGNYFDVAVGKFSSGMRARLTFALSMSFRFDVYLVDELTSVGDQIFREKANKAFTALKKRASLMFVSHNLKVVKESCDSALLLRDGAAEFFGDMDEGIFEYQKFIKEKKGIPEDDLGRHQEETTATARSKESPLISSPKGKEGEKGKERKEGDKNGSQTE